MKKGEKNIVSTDLQNGKITLIDECYLHLAEKILSAELKDYEYELKCYSQTRSKASLRRLKNIEKWLKSNYYANISLGAIDFDNFIASKRKEYKILLDL